MTKKLFLYSLLILSITACSSTTTQTPTSPPTLAPTNIPTHTATEIPLELQMGTALTAEDCVTAGLPEIACTGVTANDQWTPLVREFNGIEMVLVPTGCFQMGNDESFLEEQPVHEICFDQPFWIDRTEVTVAQFADFLNGQSELVDDLDRWFYFESLNNNMKIYIQLVQENNSWKPVYREDQRPLEYVTWFGATDYCAWRETRLPTEAEWEYSARSPNGYLYPWGNEFVRDNIVFGRNPEAGSRPQGASWVGALDMSGSLFEWTSSLFRPFPYDPSDGREASLEEDRVSNRVFKGSPWYHSLEFTDVFSVSARFDGSPDIAFWYHGFRCALSP